MNGSDLAKKVNKKIDKATEEKAMAIIEEAELEVRNAELVLKRAKRRRDNLLGQSIENIIDFA